MKELIATILVCFPPSVDIQGIIDSANLIIEEGFGSAMNITDPSNDPTVESKVLAVNILRKFVSDFEWECVDQKIIDSPYENAGTSRENHTRG